MGYVLSYVFVSIDDNEFCLVTALGYVGYVGYVNLSSRMYGRCLLVGVVHEPL